MRKAGLIWFLIYLFFGVYVINYALVFWNTPEFIADYNKWIMLAGGFLIILGGINQFRLSLRHTNLERR